MLIEAFATDVRQGNCLVDEAIALYDLGLAVVPAPSDDGKSVRGAVAGFNRWHRRLPRPGTRKLFEKHAGANIAILPHLCRPRLVIVDCDDDEALAIAKVQYGDSPLIVSTPRGSGGHLYYTAPSRPVRQQNLRPSHDGRAGVAIDIKAGPGAVVIVPPSIRPSTGVSYRFARGGWEELSSLPVFHEPAAFTQSSLAHVSAPASSGERNNRLFAALLLRARRCDAIGELEAFAHAYNEAKCAPPLPWEEVVKTALSAWGYEQRGENWVGGERRVDLRESELDRLADEPHALALLAKLRLAHAGKRERFAVSPKAMANAYVLTGWSAHRIRCAVRVLEERGFLVKVHAGGRGQADPHLFSFADRVGSKGAESTPNTNKTPSPYLLAYPMPVTTSSAAA